MKRNVERINRVADAIEAGENDWKFDMRDFFDVERKYWPDQIGENAAKNGDEVVKHNCGTTMCIAGWTCALYPDENPKQGSWSKNASAILGLEPYEAEFLFTSFSAMRRLSDKTKAAKCLRLIAVGNSVANAIIMANPLRVSPP